MSTQSSSLRQLMLGNNIESAQSSLKIAILLSILSAVTIAVGELGVSVGYVEPGSAIGRAVALILVIIEIIALIAAAAHSYSNNGVLISVTLSISPIVGLFFGYIVSALLSSAVNDGGILGPETGLYVFVILALFGIVLGVLAFFSGLLIRKIA